LPSDEVGQVVPDAFLSTECGIETAASSASTTDWISLSFR
jgi:hypothetical protein